MAKRKVVKLPTILTEDQVQALLNWFQEHTKTGYRNKTLFLLLVRSAMRISEALDAKFEDLIVTTNRNGEEAIFYRLQKSKNGRQADIPISRDTYDRFIELSKLFGSRQHGFIFRTVRSNKRMADSYFRKVGLSLGASLGFHFSPHMLRHYTLSTIYAKTQDIKIVQKTARHTSITSSEVYVHVQPEAVRDATDLIGF